MEPIVDIFGLEELKLWALERALMANFEVTDPAAFLRDNIVTYRVKFKQASGVAITITNIQKKPPEEPKS